MSNVLPFIRRMASGASDAVDVAALLRSPSHEIRAALFSVPFSPSFPSILRQIAQLFLREAISGLKSPELPNRLHVPYTFALERSADLLALADEYEQALRTGATDGWV